MTLFQTATLLDTRLHTITGYELFKRLKSTRQANIFPCHFLEPSKDCKFVPLIQRYISFQHDRVRNEVSEIVR